MKFSKLLLVAIALPGLAASPLLAAETGSWTVKVGIGMVDPDSNNLLFSDGEDTLRIDVDSATAMTLSATYMFTENWAFEILAATPFKHDIEASVAGIGAGIDGIPVKIGSTKQLPPTFSLQYHFAPDAVFQPFVGAGLNWTTFFDTKLIPELTGDGILDLDLDDSFGVAVQVGGDWILSDRMLLSLEARWMNIETDASVSGPDFGGSASIGTIKIDPWVYALSLGFRF